MPVVLELAHEVAHLRGLGRPEGRGRLVHDQDLGVEVDRAGDGDGLALAAGQRLHWLAKLVKFGFSRPMILRVSDSMLESSSEPRRVVSSRPRNRLPGASMLSASASVW